MAEKVERTISTHATDDEKPGAWSSTLPSPRLRFLVPK